MKKTTSPKRPKKRLSKSLLAELRELFFKIGGDEIYTYETGRALWKKLHGVVADIPQGLLIRLTADAWENSPGITKGQFHDLMKQIGAHTSKAIHENDAQFFRALALILKRRKEGKPIATLTRKQLGIATGSGRGRKATARNLPTAVPLALLGVLGRRVETHADPGTFTDAPISRDELKKAICNEQGKAGSEAAVEISDKELSRQITRHKIAQFME